MRRSRILVTAAVGGAILLAGAVATQNGLWWRAQLLALHAAGKIPDLGWGELIPMLRPSGEFYLQPLLLTRNPYVTITAPDTSAAAIAMGGQAFASRCASCHGSNGGGGAGPPLVGKPLSHGSSDWALYRGISRGFPGTAMPAARVPRRERWQIVAYLRELRKRADSAAPAGPSPSASSWNPVVSAQQLEGARADSANWLTYAGAYDGRRYSALGQVNRGNVARLRLLWMHQIGGTDKRLETTPLVVDGVMFVTTPTNGIRALDAETGALLWSYERELPDRLVLCCGRVNRGLAILGSSLYLATLDAHLVALDARRGTVRWDVAVADPARGYSFTSAPLAVKDMVVIGSAGGEYATRGFIDAYAAETGQRRWRFYTIPAPGEPGGDSWSGESWKTGGAPAWMTGSYDPALDLLYWGTGNPNPDYNGDGRLGDNLYSSSVVALDRANGRLRWHFQFTPHDEHDWDAGQVPMLVDGLAGERRPLLLMSTKNGFYYVLDRTTGRFLRAREFVRQTWADGMDSAGRPRVRAGSAPTRAGTLVYPSGSGAANWWATSYSPRTGLFYLHTFDRGELYFKSPIRGDNPEKRLGSMRVVAASGSGRGAIRALDALTGERRWEFETFKGIGEFLEFVGGLLSTGGDLLFGSAGDNFLALDAVSGRRLWSFNAGWGIHAAPVTYMVGGRQRVTVAAGHAILTFGLP